MGSRRIPLARVRERLDSEEVWILTNSSARVFMCASLVGSVLFFLTNCVLVPSKIFMSISRASLMGMDKFPTCGLLATQRFALGGHLCLPTRLTVPL